MIWYQQTDQLKTVLKLIWGPKPLMWPYSDTGMDEIEILGLSAFLAEQKKRFFPTSQISYWSNKIFSVQAKMDEFTREKIL